MKRIITLLAGLLAIITSLPLAAQQKMDTRDNSLLWRISGRHMAKPSYLFGTMHLICADDYLWTDQMKKCLAKSDNVCFEMNLNDPTIMTQITTGMMNNDGKKMEEYFTPEQYKIVKRYLKDSLGMDISIFQHMKPIVLESIMSANGAGCPDPISYEDTIMKTALAEKKEISGLEATQEQIDVLQSIPVDTVIKELIDEIQNTDKNDTEYHQLVTAYKNQDLPALYTLITSSKDIDEDMGVFLDERNKKWIPRMEHKMEPSSVFFAVGAGHLWGRNGVIALLRKQGYTVEPVK